MKMTYLMMRLEWKGFISSKPCRLIVVPRQEFIKHMFGKLLFFFVFPKLGISYKAKNAPAGAPQTKIKDIGAHIPACPDVLFYCHVAIAFPVYS